MFFKITCAVVQQNSNVTFGAVAGASDSTKIPCSNLVMPCKTLGNCFTLHCDTSLWYMNEYLAIDSGGYFIFVHE